MSIFKFLFVLIALFVNNLNSEPSLAPVKATTIDLQELLPSLINYFIRIFEMNFSLDYSTVTVPFVLTKVSSYGISDSISRYDVYRINRQERESGSIAMLKLSSIKCFAGVISPPNYSSENIAQLQLRTLEQILAIEYSIWYFKIVNNKIEGVKKLRISPRIYFLYTMTSALVHDTDVQKLTLHSLLTHDDTFTYFEIVYRTILSPTSEVTKQYTIELYYIRINYDCLRFYEFNCPYLQDMPMYESLNACYKKRIMNERHLFAWSMDGIENEGNSICKSHYPTIKIESHSLMKATSTFLRQDYNHTLREEICSRSPEFLFKIFKDFTFSKSKVVETSISASPEGYDFYMVGYKNEFIFITSDGTYQVKNSFSEFLTPFGIVVRWCLLSTLIVMVLVLTGLTFKSDNKNIVLVFINNLFHIFGTILEQGVDLHSLTTAKPTLVKAGKTVMFCFIPSVMILGNVYKSFLKSDFTISVPYKTGWKDLKQLVDSDFEVFVPMENCMLKGSHPHKLGVNRTIMSCKSDQPDFYEALDCEEHMLIQQYASYQRAVMIFDLGSQTTYLCLGGFREFVQTNLSKSKTALVVFRREFDYYWRLIDELRLSVTRFGHNLESEDNLLKTRRGFYIENTGDENYNLVHKRMSFLLSSGIYWLWEKWEADTKWEVQNHFKNVG
ncbi:unnamed protein product [Allacma fusca]|uniref:Uncharacterized protein n=1 Tax=Allacma fusca TaxID=39272 RepID=A0A8J2KZA2_9HEXA|nr:unnamed protein product [Allacma fusca]